MSSGWWLVDGGWKRCRGRWQLPHTRRSVAPVDDVSGKWRLPPEPRTPTPNPEPRTPNPEPRTPNPEPRTPNPEPRTPRSQNLKPDTHLRFALHAPEGQTLAWLGALGNGLVAVVLVKRHISWLKGEKGGWQAVRVGADMEGIHQGASDSATLVLGRDREGLEIPVRFRCLRLQLLVRKAEGMDVLEPLPCARGQLDFEAVEVVLIEGFVRVAPNGLGHALDRADCDEHLVTSTRVSQIPARKLVQRGGSFIRVWPDGREKGIVLKSAGHNAGGGIELVGGHRHNADRGPVHADTPSR